MILSSTTFPVNRLEIPTRYLGSIKRLAAIFLIPSMMGFALFVALEVRFHSACPNKPEPKTKRVIPRQMNGRVVYLRRKEDLLLTAVETGSIVLLILGTAIGIAFVSQTSLS